MYWDINKEIQNEEKTNKKKEKQNEEKTNKNKEKKKLKKILIRI